LKAATTKRYYVTKEEVKERMELQGDIEEIHKITPYEHDQESDLKDMDFIITTVIDIEEQDPPIMKNKLPSDARYPK